MHARKASSHEVDDEIAFIFLKILSVFSKASHSKNHFQ
jgi:hypothetical protein